MRAPDAAFGQAMVALVHGSSQQLRQLSLGVHLPSDTGRSASAGVLLSADDDLAVQRDIASVVQMVVSGELLVTTPA